LNRRPSANLLKRLDEARDSAPGSRWGRWALSAGLLLFALVTWSFVQAGGDSLSSGLLFLVAAGAVLLALRRWIGVALLLIGVMALGVSPSAGVELDVWGGIFVLATAAGALVSLRRWPGLRWLAASFPFWAMSDAAEWSMYVAMGMVLLGLVLTAVAPTLPGRPIRGGEPLPHLAQGAFVTVEPRLYPLSRRGRVLPWTTAVFAILTLVLGLFAVVGPESPTVAALVIASGLISVAFAFSWWFSTRVRLRIDADGLHSRVFYGEHTIRWAEISSLSLRYLFLPGMGARIIYYCVRSPRREFAFPSSMRGAPELQASIEAATEMSWPLPRITANL
jgi:hypothetical protein